MSVDRRRTLALLALAAMVASGCGSRVDHDRVVAAAEGRSAAGSGQLAGTTGGDSTGTGGATGLGSDGGTGSTVTGETTGSTGTTGGSGTTGAGGSAGTATTGSSGSSGGSATTGTTGGTRDTAPIKVGTVGTLSGIAGGAQKPGPDGFAVWVKWANARGGVNGHLIRHFVRDDAGDTARHSSAVKEMVESVGVSALVAQWASQTQQASADYLLRKQIPVIGGDRTGDNSWGKNPIFFPEAAVKNTALEAVAAALAYVAIPKGKKRLGILVCAEAANVCALGAQIIAKYAPKVGFQVVYNQQASFAQPTYTSECINMRSAQVDAGVLIMPASAVRKIASDCAQQGVRPAWALGNGTSDGDFNKYAYFDGAAVNAPVFMFSGTPTSPAFDEFRAAFKRFAPGVTVNAAHAVGWANGKLFESVIRRVRGPVTNRTILDALYTVKNETVGGLTIPLTYTRNKATIPGRCWFPGTITKGQWVALNGGKYVCR